jgi:hypothetical protein
MLSKDIKLKEKNYIVIRKMAIIHFAERYSVLSPKVFDGGNGGFNTPYQTWFNLIASL